MSAPQTLRLPDGKGGWMTVTVARPDKNGGWATVVGGTVAPPAKFTPDDGPVRNIATNTAKPKASVGKAMPSTQAPYDSPAMTLCIGALKYVPQAEINRYAENETHKAATIAELKDYLQNIKDIPLLDPATLTRGGIQDGG